jgi:hypothetical protein
VLALGDGLVGASVTVCRDRAHLHCAAAAVLKVIGLPQAWPKLLEFAPRLDRESL